MPLVLAENLTIAYRGPALLDAVNFTIEPGQRIGLLGRNGAGKTTLMKILAGQVEPDHGSVQFQPGTRVAMLSQDVPDTLTGSVMEVVRGCLMVTEGGPKLEAWEIQHQCEKILSQMSLEPELRFEQLSSGLKRRVLLARALVNQPDLLLLDEPTNHLDIDSIGWLESFLGKASFAFLFVTHDRMFLRNLATRILEIDRGQLFDWTCDYDQFLHRKQDALHAEEKQNALFDKRLAEEEAWIRQGIKARRTRNEGRVRALKTMREQHRERRKKIGTSRLQIQEADRSGRLVIEAEEIAFAYDGQAPAFEDFSTSIMRGDKIGIVGSNGAGKTTLLKTLLGELAPGKGTVKLGTNLEVAYFDQLREQLDLEQSVAENVGQGSDHVEVQGARKHVLGYLQDFLFSPQRARTPVKFLSGGEKNRILLAKLFTRPANLIVLDEPTNDLDAETLELLESKLVEFSGTVLVVSHDREFLNHVVTSTLVFEPEGLKEYAGGYDDWQRQRQARLEAEAKRGDGANGSAEDKDNAGSPGQHKNRSKDGQSKTRKLSYKEKRELDSLPEAIESLEQKIAQHHEQMADPDFYQQPGEAIALAQAQIADLNQQLQGAYQRWEELELIAEGI